MNAVIHMWIAPITKTTAEATAATAERTATGNYMHIHFELVHSLR